MEKRTDIQIAQRVATVALEEKGWRMNIVGGWVRDFILDIPSKDIDVEVFGPRSFDELNTFLSRFAHTNIAGKRFGVVKLHTGNGMPIDFSLPRRDSKNGVGHKGFEIEIDSNMTGEEASWRRDFTINAMSFSLNSGMIHDPHGGIEDLRNHRLRHVGPAFVEDPVRVMRGFQICGRLNLTAEKETVTLCRALLPEFEFIGSSELWDEWFKWASKSIKPSRGLVFLHRTSWIVKLPALNNLLRLKQDPMHHPGKLSFKTRNLPINPGLASTAKAVCVDIGLPTKLWKLISLSETEATVIPGLSCTPRTQSIMNCVIGSFSLTDLTWTNSTHLSSHLGIAPSTQPKRFIWKLRKPALDADKVFRVMFKVPISSMKRIMLRSTNDLEVFERIIHSVSVNVMNMFPSFKVSTNVQAHNISMQSNSTPALGVVDILISSVIADFEPVAINDYIFLYYDFALISNIHAAPPCMHDNMQYLTCQAKGSSVWVHTKIAVDQAVQIAIREKLSAEDRAVLVFAALLHDIGKAETTTVLEDGRIISHGHDEAGEQLAIDFLKSIGAPKTFLDRVPKLVRRHMVGCRNLNQVTRKSVRKLAVKVSPSTIGMLCLLIEVDLTSRSTDRNLEIVAKIMSLAKDVDVIDGKPKPILMGRHLIGIGRKPGKGFGEILAVAFEHQLNDEFSTPEEAITLMNLQKEIE